MGSGFLIKFLGLWWLPVAWEPFKMFFLTFLPQFLLRSGPPVWPVCLHAWLVPGQDPGFPLSCLSF